MMGVHTVRPAGLGYLLDTNIISELSRPEPAPSVIQQLVRWQGSCALSVTVVEELTFGIKRLPEGKRRTLLEEWLLQILSSFVILPYDIKAASWLGQERARLMREGKTLPRPDGQIAAVAITHELTLVTRNIADFQHIDGLRLENWFA